MEIKESVAQKSSHDMLPFPLSLCGSTETHI
jgi:hypothetical protein